MEGRGDVGRFGCFECVSARNEPAMARHSCSDRALEPGQQQGHAGALQTDEREQQLAPFVQSLQPASCGMGGTGIDVDCVTAWQLIIDTRCQPHLHVVPRLQVFDSAVSQLPLDLVSNDLPGWAYQVCENSG